MATIKDVARVAGTSFKTVSRVVNGEPNVGPELRRRIEEAIRELNYRPVLAARQLAGNRTFVLTLIISPYVGSYVSRMMIALAAQCRAVGYHLVTEICQAAPDGSGALLMPEFSVRSDAIIVIPPFSDHPGLLEHLAKFNLPVIRIAAIDRSDSRVIPVDDTKISAELVSHLFDLGHKRIGMIGPPLPEKASETRVAGYRLALERAGLPFDANLLVRGDFSFASGAEGATRLLALSDRPTAIFAAADSMALGAMARARQLGYSIPTDLAVAGFDDAPESRMVWPPLTTVYQPISEIAQAAVHLATARGAAPGPLRHTLMLRGSTTGSGDLCLDPYAE